MHYYLSIGTNIEPERNAADIIKMLAQAFGPFVMYPFIYTQPDRIPTTNIFLNTTAIVFSLSSLNDTKNELNKIEIALGRNRDDPARSTKDRTADIDILGQSEIYDDGFFYTFNECYIKNVIDQNAVAANLSAFGLPPTKGASTVDIDTRSGHIRILENAAYRLEYWHKSTFPLQ